jgi:hypothetical protein
MGWKAEMLECWNSNIPALQPIVFFNQSLQVGFDDLLLFHRLITWPGLCRLDL